MRTIGVLSDTHGGIDPDMMIFFEHCDEIWHAGDIGNIETANELMSKKNVIAVYGNIDDYIVRKTYPEFISFKVEGVDILMMHIGGYPGSYSPLAKTKILELRPKIFVCGHSHILKIIYDKKYELLHINPGACGNNGFHNLKTAVRFKIDGEKILEMEIWEKDRH